MLTEECVFPKGSDATYLQKINKAFRTHETFIELKTSQTEFGIKHFAGEVTYAVDAASSRRTRTHCHRTCRCSVEFSDDPFVSNLMKTAKEIVAEEALAAMNAAPERAARRAAASASGAAPRCAQASLLASSTASSCRSAT